MQIKNEIISNFRNFIQLNGTIDEAQQLLKKYRNITIGDFNLKDSRCVWMSLLLYKFKQEMNVSDDLWTHSRQLIISLLRSDDDVKNTIDKYLKIFIVWQNEDAKDVIKDIGSNYYNLLQIKNSIEKTENEETINHWLPHYQTLIQKIRSYCKSMGILNKLDDFIFTIEQQKYDIIKEIMNKAYWDKFEEDIKENNLDIVYSNISELKTTLYDIVPKSEIQNIKLINEYLDVEYIKHIVEHKVFDKEFLLKLFFFVIKILKEWDSKVFEEKYDKEIAEINEINDSLIHLIRYVLEKLIVLSVDLKNRKTLWNIILKN
jgi:hypothetical protein